MSSKPKQRFFYHPESDCLFAQDAELPHPGDHNAVVDELDELQYFFQMSQLLHLWPWRGKWHVVKDGAKEPIHTTGSKTAARDFVHGYTGHLPLRENIHD